MGLLIVIPSEYLAWEPGATTVCGVLLLGASFSNFQVDVPKAEIKRCSHSIDIDAIVAVMHIFVLMLVEAWPKQFLY
jgi:hypothetical protein